MTAFEKAVAIVLDHEGGFVDNPADKGGPTKYGISHRSYPDLDIAALTLERARAIYFRDFWEPLQANDLPEPIAIVLFDAAVNMGQSAAVCCLQRAVGTRPDGILGPITKEAVKAKYGRELVGEITSQRIMFYASLETFQTFGLGWVRRSIKTLMEIVEQSVWPGENNPTAWPTGRNPRNVN